MPLVLRPAVAAVGRWLRSVGPERAHLRADIVAGLPGAIGSVPDGMAAAILAGVNPAQGLYASFAGPIAGGLTASTRMMVITTTSAAALAAGSALQSIPADKRPAAIPLLVIIKISFSESIVSQPPYMPLLTIDDQGDVQLTLHLSNFIYLGQDSLYLLAFLSSLKIALISTIVALFVGWMGIGLGYVRHLVIPLVSLPTMLVLAYVTQWPGHLLAVPFATCFCLSMMTAERRMLASRHSGGVSTTIVISR